MKLRAPRCKEAMLVTSSAARHVIQSAPAPPPASVAAAAAPLATMHTRSSARLRVPMKNHSIRDRFRLVDARVPRHLQKVCEIAAGKDARQDHVEPLGGLQAQIAENDEGDG